MTREEIIEARRVKFEEWVLSVEHPVLGWIDKHWLVRSDNGATYANEYLAGLWFAHSTFSIEPMEIELPSVSMSECLTKDEWKAIKCGIDMCAKAIEAQGLKVKP